MIYSSVANYLVSYNSFGAKTIGWMHAALFDDNSKPYRHKKTQLSLKIKSE